MKLLLNLYRKKYNILIVDDIKENVDLIESYLKEKKEIKIYKSYDPLKSETILKKVNFSLILLDIQMPNLNGYELATKIKNGEYIKNKLVPIVFITGIYDNINDKMKGYNIGSIDYILKPINIDIINKIEKYIHIKTNKQLLKQRIFNIKKSINI